MTEVIELESGMLVCNGATYSPKDYPALATWYRKNRRNPKVTTDSAYDNMARHILPNIPDNRIVQQDENGQCRFTGKKFKFVICHKDCPWPANDGQWPLGDITLVCVDDDRGEKP